VKPKPGLGASAVPRLDDQFERLLVA
jgi:hypothetical protein